MACSGGLTNDQLIGTWTVNEVANTNDSTTHEAAVDLLSTLLEEGEGTFTFYEDGELSFKAHEGTVEQRAKFKILPEKEQIQITGDSVFTYNVMLEGDNLMLQGESGSNLILKRK